MPLSDHIKNCLDRAAEAKLQADQTAERRQKVGFLRLERSWNCQAQSFQFAEELERILLDNARVVAEAWRPVSTAPFDRELELAVIGSNGTHSLAFPCRRVLGGWIDARTNQQIELAPTHWREWAEFL